MDAGLSVPFFSTLSSWYDWRNKRGQGCGLWAVGWGEHGEAGRMGRRQGAKTSEVRVGIGIGIGIGIGVGFD